MVQWDGASTGEREIGGMKLMAGTRRETWLGATRGVFHVRGVVTRRRTCARYEAPSLSACGDATF